MVCEFGLVGIRSATVPHPPTPGCAPSAHPWPPTVAVFQHTGIPVATPRTRPPPKPAQWPRPHAPPFFFSFCLRFTPLSVEPMILHFGGGGFQDCNHAVSGDGNWVHRHDLVLRYSDFDIIVLLLLSPPAPGNPAGLSAPRVPARCYFG